MSMNISKLYNSGEISGDTYLLCVENDIDTLEDAIKAGYLQAEDFQSYLQVSTLVDVKNEFSSTDTALHDDAIDPIEVHDIESIRQDVQLRMNDLSVRGFHAVESLMNEAKTMKSFIQKITDPEFKVERLHAIGRKTIPELKSFFSDIIELANTFIPKPEEPDYEALDRQLLPYFMSILYTASTRAKNALVRAFQGSNESVWELYKQIHEPGFSPLRWENVGRKCGAELYSILKDFSEVVDSYLNGNINKEIINQASIQELKLCGVQAGFDDIHQFSNEKGYFPYFKAVDAYIGSLEDKHKEILKKTLAIYNECQIDSTRKDIAAALGLSAERVRQLRNKILEKVFDYTRSLVNEQDKKEEHDVHSYSIDEIPSINTIEGTDFSDNFIAWMLSTISSTKYTLLGNIEDAMFAPYGNTSVVHLIPKHLADIFDFKRFYREFENISQSKRYEDQEIELKNVILRFFIDRIYYEHIQEIEGVCKSIVIRSFNYKILGSTLYIPKNSERNNPELVEIIVRETGHPMTIEEIYNEFEKRYPGKTKSQVALSGAIRMCENLRPVGRSSTFTLKEWMSGEERGGTIREFAEEYLLSLPEPIAILEDIGQYVRQFRPSSTDKSIHSNLMLDGDSSYSVYYKDGVRYIGLSNYDYSDAYKKLEPGTGAKRDFKKSCTFLETFVAENGRLPFSHSVPEEEKRLNRFWKVQLSKLSKGALSKEEASIIRSMQDRFSSLKINKKDYDWFQKHQIVKNAFMNGFPVSTLSETLQEWFSYQIRGYRYNYIPEDKRDYIAELLEIQEKNVR